MSLDSMYTSRTRRAILIASLLLLLSTFLIEYTSTRLTTRLNSCFISHETRKEAMRTTDFLIPLSDSRLHLASVLTLWAALALSTIMLPAGRVLSAYVISVGSLWFHTTYIVLNILKVPLADFNCTSRLYANYPNALSGHYCYFLFTLLTLPRAIQFRFRSYQHLNNNNNRRDGTNHKRNALLHVCVYLLATLVMFFNVGAVFTLYRTFFHGYHSLKQVLLGSSLGLFSHVSLDWFLFVPEFAILSSSPASASASASASAPASPQIEQQLQPATFTPSKLMLLLANSLTVSALYIRLWPHQQAGNAISNTQFAFHACLYAAIVLCGAKLRSWRMKTKQAAD